MRVAERRGRRGFTVIEVVVALAVASIVLLGGRLLLEGIAVQTRSIVNEARVQDQRANDRRLLRDLVLQLQVSVAPRLTFTASETGATFSSWCRQPGGWEELCKVTIAITDSMTTPELTVTTSGRPPLGMHDEEAPIALRYLADPQAGGTWLRGWGESLTPPRAIGVLRTRDTLILRVGRAP